MVIGAGSGLGAVAFRYLIYFFTWLATGRAQFGQDGHAGSWHLPWLGWRSSWSSRGVGGLVYGPLIYRYAREARGHGVPEVMIAVAGNGGRIRPPVSVVKAVASAVCIGTGGSVGREGPIVQIGSALASAFGQRAKMPEPGRLRRGRRHRGDVQRAGHRRVLRRGDHLAGVLGRRPVHGDAVGDARRRGRDPVPG